MIETQKLQKVKIKRSPIVCLTNNAILAKALEDYEWSDAQAWNDAVQRVFKTFLRKIACVSYAQEYEVGIETVPVKDSVGVPAVPRETRPGWTCWRAAATGLLCRGSATRRRRMAC